MIQGAQGCFTSGWVRKGVFSKWRPRQGWGGGEWRLQGVEEGGGVGGSKGGYGGRVAPGLTVSVSPGGRSDVLLIAAT